MLPSNHLFFQYCDSNIVLFSIAPCKVITLNPHRILFVGFLSKVIALPTIAIAIVVALSCCRNSWKSDNYMGSNTEKKQNSYKNLSKEIKSDNFCYRKVKSDN